MDDDNIIIIPYDTVRSVLSSCLKKQLSHPTFLESNNCQKMRSQPPGVMSLHDAVTLAPTKSNENKSSPSSSPVSTSQPDIALDCQNLSPNSKCSDWKQKNEVTC